MLEKLSPSIGEALLNQRAGAEQTVFARLSNRWEAWRHIDVSSSAFTAEGNLPSRFSSDGAGLSPPLQWSQPPEEASSVVVIVEDADSPSPHPLVHAIVVNLDVRESSLAEGALDSPDHEGVGLLAGRNSFLSHAWLPPDPPPGHGRHRYIFQVFALQGALFQKAPGRDELFHAVDEHAIAAGFVIATYERSQQEPLADITTLDSAITPA
jgi:Raf kinase inhibitor-like YbhB/YbcL family protein